MKRVKKILVVFVMTFAVLGTWAALRAFSAQAAEGRKMYTITYNANGGEGEPEGQKKIHDVTLILPSEIPTRAGYKFRGWATTTHPQDIYPAGAEYTANRGAKFYAIWDVNEYTIHYNANGGFGAPDDQKKIKGETLVLSDVMPIRVGYEFRGWATTTHPDELFDAGAEYSYDRGANFYAIWKQLPYGANKVTLDGVKEHHFVSSDYCFIETEKCVYLLDKGIEIPGDFVENVEAIVDAIEELLGLSYQPDTYEQASVNKLYGVYSSPEYPWEGWKAGKKIQIFLNVNSEISYAQRTGAMLAKIDLYFVETEDPESPTTLPETEKQAHIDYAMIAHELTHTFSQRSCYTSKMMTEGLADYVKVRVLNSLSADHPSIAIAKDHMVLHNWYLPEAVNADTAERIFMDDYHNASVIEREDGYYVGRVLCTFLSERFGDDFYRRYNDIIYAKHLMYFYGIWTEENAQAFTDGMKEAFGEDVFIEFGNWCVEHDQCQRIIYKE